MPLEASLRGCVGVVDSARIVRAAISRALRFVFRAHASFGALRGVPAEGAADDRINGASGKMIFRLRRDAGGSEGETSPFEKTEPE